APPACEAPSPSERAMPPQIESPLIASRATFIAPPNGFHMLASPSSALLPGGGLQDADRQFLLQFQVPSCPRVGVSHQHLARISSHDTRRGRKSFPPFVGDLSFGGGEVFRDPEDPRPEDPIVAATL